MSTSIQMQSLVLTQIHFHSLAFNNKECDVQIWIGSAQFVRFSKVGIALDKLEIGEVIRI